jgi:NAD(P)-dependent dehydrogenase (short-subunit alcohol dehydrogenase family)
MLLDIAGRGALVTGSSRGIGHALAAGLLDAGCTVVINGRDAGRLEQVREAFASDRVTAVAFDAADPAAVAEGVAIAEDAAGPIDIAGTTAYPATKGALKMLAKGICADLAGHGIQVNAIGPGYFATELTQALAADEQFSARVRRRTPAGRWGEVKDLVGPLLFLASPAADFVNGHILYVDGGMLSVP